MRHWRKKRYLARPESPRIVLSPEAYAQVVESILNPKPPTPLLMEMMRKNNARQSRGE